MTHDELRERLALSLSRLYDLDVVAKLAEFFQGELRILFYLHQHGGPGMNPSTLSSALHVSRARITAALSALRRKKYIRMEMCEHDRRRMRVMLTADGKEFIRKKREEVEKQFDTLIIGLGSENTREFIRLIDMTANVMENADAGANIESCTQKN